MIKKLLPNLFLIVVLSINAQNITVVDFTDSDVEGVFYGEGLWLDTTNDDIFEILLTGNSTNHSQYTVLANFDGTTFNVDTDNSLIALTQSSSDRADFNNDGFMDFIITGADGSANKTALYFNDGNGQYTLQTTSISGAYLGKIRAEDLNNDGLIDVMITGFMEGGYGAELYYQNVSGGFDEASVSLMANYFGDITFIDVNNDNYLDVLLTGFDASYAPNTKLYINTNGVLNEAPTQSIDPYYFTGTGVLDVDNDGDKDLVISGFNSSYSAEMAIYLNDGTGEFVKDVASMNNFTQVYFGDMSIVDYDNDGYDDIFSTGQNSSGTYSSKIYMNNGSGDFTEDTGLSNVIADVGISSCKWEDFDNDGDQDLLLTGFNNSNSNVTAVYRNDTTLSLNSVIEDEVKIYPNPTSDVLNISGLEGSVKVSIQNYLGQTVIKHDNVKHSIDVSTLQNGIYILLVEISSDREQVMKFVKK